MIFVSTVSSFSFFECLRGDFFRGDSTSTLDAATTVSQAPTSDFLIVDSTGANNSPILEGADGSAAAGSGLKMESIFGRAAAFAFASFSFSRFFSFSFFYFVRKK